MKKAFYVCEHGANPAECKDCKIKLLQDSLATQQEMPADLADELKIAESNLAEARAVIERVREMNLGNIIYALQISLDASASKGAREIFHSQIALIRSIRALLLASATEKDGE